LGPLHNNLAIQLRSSDWNDPLFFHCLESPPVFHAIMSLIVLTYISISSVPRPFQEGGYSRRINCFFLHKFLKISGGEENFRTIAYQHLPIHFHRSIYRPFPINSPRRHARYAPRLAYMQNMPVDLGVVSQYSYRLR
jgi:hypothetical protein